MFLPIRLLALELKRNSCLKLYHNYLKILRKIDNNTLRIKFLRKKLLLIIDIACHYHRERLGFQ